jgi:hypothetical protein
MRPPETLPNGTTLHYVEGGYRIRRPEMHSFRRIRVRLVRGDHGTWWRARCDAWNGFTWEREWTIARTLLACVEMAVSQYAAELDGRYATTTSHA